MTLNNYGDVTLCRFADWDAIMQVQMNPCLKIAYLNYTENVNLGSDQWPGQGIYSYESTLKSKITEI